MLKFSDYVLDQELFNAETEEIQEGLMHNFLRKLKGKDAEEITKLVNMLQDPNTTEKILSRHSKHSNPVVRMIVAKHKNTPEAIKNSYANDPNEWISVVKAANAGKGFKPVTV